MDLKERRTKAKDLFASYLKAKGGRWTPEREAVLDEIVAMKSDFVVDDLEQLLAAGNFPISHATLYNTIRELVQAHLVHKFQVGRVAHYQYLEGKSQNLHLVCDVCGKVTDFQYPEVERMLRLYKPRRFAVKDFFVTIQGVCSTCITRQKKLARKNNRNKIKR